MAADQRENRQYGKSHYISNPILDFIDRVTLRLHPAQEGLRKVTYKHTHYKMLSDAAELQLICNIARSIGAKNALDIGVYTGYSALSLALILPDGGKVIACDIDAEMPAIGQKFWKEAGVEDKIDLRIAPAAETLDKLIQDGKEGTFDVVFIDADKENYGIYYEQGLKLLRPGGFIAIDNALWMGRVADPNEMEPNTVAIRKVVEKAGKDPRVNASLLTIGDGTMLAFKV